MKHLNKFKLNEEVKSGWEKIDYDGAGRFLDGVLSISGITTGEDKISQDGRSWFKCDQVDQLMDLIKQAIYYHNK